MQQASKCRYVAGGCQLHIHELRFKHRQQAHTAAVQISSENEACCRAVDAAQKLNSNLLDRGHEDAAESCCTLRPLINSAERLERQQIALTCLGKSCLFFRR